MVSKKYNPTIKSISLFGEATPEDMLTINKISRVPLKPEDVVVFTIRMCDTLVDRVFDQLSETFLQQFAALANDSHLTGLKDHIWDVDNQWARLIKAEVKTDENGVEYVEGRVYTLAANKELVEKIKTGIAGEISVSFNGKCHCSICGNQMEKWSPDDTAYCGTHQAGEEYDGELCVNIYDECTDALEFSLVAIPCQPGASVIKSLNSKDLKAERLAAKDKKQPVVDTVNNVGGQQMTKKTFALKRLLAKKSLEKLEDRQVNDLLNVISDETEEDKELTSEDISALIAENEDLKAEIEKLKAEIDELKAKAAEDAEKADEERIDVAIDDELEKLGCHTPVVKELMAAAVDRTSLKYDANTKSVSGLSEALEPVLKRFEGLYGKKEVTPSESKDMPKVSFGRTKTNAERKSFHEACSKM